MVGNRSQLDRCRRLSNLYGELGCAGCGVRAIVSGVDLRDVVNHTLLAGGSGGRAAPALHAIASGGGGGAATLPGGVTGGDGGGTAPRKATRTPAGKRQWPEGPLWPR